MQSITTNRKTTTTTTTTKQKKKKNVNKCGRWKVQNRTVVALYREKKEKKKFFKKLNVEEIKCRNTSTSSQVSNCDGVVLEIYFDNKLQ